MTPLLIAGILVALVGATLLLLQAFRASPTWGWVCVLLPPAQWLFALLHWRRAWEPLLMQVSGVAIVGMFFFQAGGFDAIVLRQVWADLQRDMGVVASSSASGTVINSSGQQVSTVVTDDSPSAVNDGQVHQVTGNVGPSTVVVAAPEKAVDDKPIYRCIDQQGNERYSAKPCGGPQTIPAKK